MSQSPHEHLSADRIKNAMSATGRIALHHLDIYEQLDSTNSELQRQAAAGAPSGTACLADCQTAGRGRRGHVWHSPPAVNLYLSLLWRYPLPPAALGGTSLAVGAVVAEVLQAAGGIDLHLKWPNDVLWRGRKVAGLLLEVGGHSQGSSYLIVGVGLNVHMTATLSNEIAQPWAALADAISERPLSRNQLAGQLLDALITALECYGREGVAPFLARWRQFDAWIGHPVQLICANQIVNGIHSGIAEDGALQLNTASGMRTFHAGEVSLRKQ
ncbi:biotin--[acetyl-CoA-carboxylase] ligase [Chromatium okenii]|uniref:biotin--[acetyl-CoA-carboxylase] ligase n=1 Tax=Chromatium okenii TaxID=61644 RepID=UPI001F5B6C65|nr:biotin--[acetyl-CoA-carboxylase] ligase [Chromatium okenii]